MNGRLVLRMVGATFAALMLFAAGALAGVDAALSVPVDVPSQCKLVSFGEVAGSVPGKGLNTGSVRQLRTWDYVCPMGSHP